MKCTLYSCGNEQECKHITAENPQTNEKTEVRIKCPKLDTFLNSLAFSKLCFKKAQVRSIPFKSCRFWPGPKLGALFDLAYYWPTDWNYPKKRLERTEQAHLLHLALLKTPWLCQTPYRKTRREERGRESYFRCVRVWEAGAFLI